MIVAPPRSARRSPISPTVRSASAIPAARRCLLACLVLRRSALWYRTLGTVSVNIDQHAEAETFYWVTITFSQTLGTALGDWMADTGGSAIGGGALVFAAGLAVVAALYFWTSVSRDAAVLDRLHPDAAARRHGRRFPRQAARPRRPGAQPTARFRSDCGVHRGLHAALAAACRPTSRAIIERLSKPEDGRRPR